MLFYTHIGFFCWKSSGDNGVSQILHQQLGFQPSAGADTWYVLQNLLPFLFHQRPVQVQPLSLCHWPSSACQPRAPRDKSFPQPLSLYSGILSCKPMCAGSVCHCVIYYLWWGIDLSIFATLIFLSGILQVSKPNFFLAFQTS